MKTKDIDNSEEPLEVLGKVEPNVLFQAMSDLYNRIRTPERLDNKTVEDSSATFDTSNSPSNLDRSPKQFSRQELDKFRAELLDQSKIQMEIDRKNMEKQIQNHYLSELKTMEIEHERQLAIIESKLAEQKQSDIQSIQAAANEQKLKHIETIKLLQQKVQTLEHGSNQNNLDMKTSPHNSLTNAQSICDE